jgi:ribosome maturation factor RimP
VDARPLFLFRPPKGSGCGRAKSKMRSELREELTRRFQALLEEEAFDLWDLEIAAQSGRTVLRVFLDRAVDRGPGVTVDDCSYWNKKLGRYLEAENVLRGAYVLEVGSPGIERALTRPEHFARYVGSQVEVRLHDPKDGRRTFRGELRAAGAESIVVEDAEVGSVSLPLAGVRRSRLVADPWEGLREPKRKHGPTP